MASQTMNVVNYSQTDMKQNIISMTQTMITIREETDNLLQETHRILQEKANTTAIEKPTTKMMMPETQHFVQEYLSTHKPELEAIDPFTKGAKARIRRLLAEMLHQAIDAVAADVIESFQVRDKKRGSALSDATIRDREDKGDEEEMMGDMSEDEDVVEMVADGKAEELGVMVDEEMAELSEVVKEAIDDALW